MNTRDLLTTQGKHEITLSDNRVMEYEINRRRNCASCGVIINNNGKIENLSNNQTNKLFWNELESQFPEIYEQDNDNNYDNDDDNDDYFSELDYENINY